MQFEWDSRKAQHNKRKHGVEFEEASTVFADDLALTFDDPDHSLGERRLITFGTSSLGNTLVVSHTEDGDTPRIIYARPMTRREVNLYEQY